ncbi:hypothetical protein Q8A67_022975 [Cirrhinus molitorella]|uniref:Uncharacterized protein n=1 Tax=Cirrhinus molitorella TaxID=172907 RepID=A0AA88TDY3_9TELE|nr:hypothetical protein Q8A67_022975 [Cirrhinus molitorella]
MKVAPMILNCERVSFSSITTVQQSFSVRLRKELDCARQGRRLLLSGAAKLPQFLPRGEAPFISPLTGAFTNLRLSVKSPCLINALRLLGTTS